MEFLELQLEVPQNWKDEFIDLEWLLDTPHDVSDFDIKLVNFEHRWNSYLVDVAERFGW